MAGASMRCDPVAPGRFKCKLTSRDAKNWLRSFESEYETRMLTGYSGVPSV